MYKAMTATLSLIAMTLLAGCQTTGGANGLLTDNAQTTEQLAMQAAESSLAKQGKTDQHIPLSHSHSSSSSSWDTGRQGGCIKTKHGKKCHFSERGGSTKTTHSSSSSLDIHIN